MTVPYSFQRKTVRKIDRLGGRALIAHEMGLGKSFTSLLWASQYPDRRPIVIVCPATVKYTWEREAKKHFGLICKVLEGSRAPLGRTSATNPPIYVINYDILHGWCRFLRNRNPQIVIVDECHYIGSRSSRRTKAVAELCGGVPHVLCLSGTPMLNRPIELWPALNILRPELFGSVWKFAHRYCKPRKTYWGWKFEGSSREAELHAILKKDVMSRRLKRDVLKQLPDKIRTVVPLAIADKKSYENAVGDFSSWLRKSHPGKIPASAASAALTKVGYIKRLVAQLKLRSVLDWIGDFLEESDGKLLMFAIHKNVIREIRDKFRAESVVIDGSVTGANRNHAINKFTKNSSTRLMIGNMRAAGVGWDGTAASDVAFAELEWNGAMHVQSEDRAHRIGAKDTVRAHYLIAQGTIEEWICRKIHRKMATINKIIDGESDAADMDLLSALLEKLRAGDETGEKKWRSGRSPSPRSSRRPRRSS